MLPEEIINILQNYQSEVSEEISNINLSLDRIKDAINSVSCILMNEVLSFSKNTGTKNVEKEMKLHHDSIKLREFSDSIEQIKYKNSISKTENLDIYDIIVLSNITRCSSLNHKIKDVKISVPVLQENDNVSHVTICASYCFDCKRYTILKDTFNRIEGVILCQIIDETKQYDKDNNTDFEIEQSQSILYKYGYNVKSKQNLSQKQRQIILASLVESNILTRAEITSHLNTLIDRGNKIPSWKEATQKWKQDKYYVEKYKTENLPSVIFDKIILKYSSVKKIEE